MPTKTKKQTINIPINGLTFLRKNEKNGKAVCEVDFDLLEQVNKPNMIDLMVREARKEYKTGKTKGFTDAESLIADLKS